MEIPLNKDWLKTLHDTLVLIYQNTDDPISSGIPIVPDYNESLISICVERYKTKVYGKTLYPHTLQRAAVLMHSIISFHPFVDGNKRTALLSTDFYLHWNGYNFIIPSDADDFTIDVAKDKRGLNDILRWLEGNSKMTPYTVLRHWVCETNLGTNEVPLSKRITSLPSTFFIPLHAINFFRTKIIEKQFLKELEET